MRTPGTARGAQLGLPKCPTGIAGFDEVVVGGLPRGRTTLVCGGAGCGKTLFGVEFLVRGAVEFGEPGVLVTFEETADELAANVASLGFDLRDLIERKQLVVDHVLLDRAQIVETGEFDLSGLFVRLAAAVDAVGAKRLLLDTVEVLFATFTDALALRSELQRLFRWLKERELTAIVTAEQGEGHLTRHGIEEYVSDCVIVLDHRVRDTISTRRLRIAKYRGSSHGSNEYPFVIDRTGFSVLPITSLGLAQRASTKRISSGIPDLDEMLGGKGFYRGSAILVSGASGTGKTSIAASMVDAACRGGETCAFLAFEESPDQLVRDMRSISLDLGQWTSSGLLQLRAERPTTLGLELHLLGLHRLLDELRPSVVVLDPITSLEAIGDAAEVRGALTRVVDLLKTAGTTAVFTSLTGAATDTRETHLISSLIDSWLLVRDVEANGERNRLVYILKSRGMAHSNQVREFLITDAGLRLVEPYLGEEGVFVGTARTDRQALDRQHSLDREAELQARRERLERRRVATAAQIEGLQAELAAEEAEVARASGHDAELAKLVEESRRVRAERRGAATDGNGRVGGRRR